MEVLEVSGYITEEKAAIASKYLSPQAKEGAGLKSADVELSDDAVAALIRYYCRESGVRRLKQQIEKVRSLLPVLLAAGTDLRASCYSSRSTARLPFASFRTSASPHCLNLRRRRSSPKFRVRPPSPETHRSPPLPRQTRRSRSKTETLSLHPPPPRLRPPPLNLLPHPSPRRSGQRRRASVNRSRCQRTCMCAFRRRTCSTMSDRLCTSATVCTRGRARLVSAPVLATLEMARARLCRSR